MFQIRSSCQRFCRFYRFWRFVESATSVFSMTGRGSIPTAGTILTLTMTPAFPGSNLAKLAGRFPNMRLRAWRRLGRSHATTVPCEGLACKAFCHERSRIRPEYWMDLCGLAVEKFDEFRDHLIRRFFHEPVSGVANDHAFHIRRHKPALLNQALAGGFFASQNQHRHG